MNDACCVNLKVLQKETYQYFPSTPSLALSCHLIDLIYTHHTQYIPQDCIIGGYGVSILTVFCMVTAF